MVQIADRLAQGSDRFFQIALREKEFKHLEEVSHLILNRDEVGIYFRPFVFQHSPILPDASLVRKKNDREQKKNRPRRGATAGSLCLKILFSVLPFPPLEQPGPSPMS